jgi:hypothetical protein
LHDFAERTLADNFEQIERLDCEGSTLSICVSNFSVVVGERFHRK